MKPFLVAIIAASVMLFPVNIRKDLKISTISAKVTPSVRKTTKAVQLIKIIKVQDTAALAVNEMILHESFLMGF